jgi:hypothetical protein
MLEYAAELYDGPIDVAGGAISQGSYSGNGPASFGTHLGGGAVDLSVLQPGDDSVLRMEIEPLIRALRTAGFAAWLRDWDELYRGSAIHIHAIAIGDTDLSLAAKQQLDGPFGYFRGYTGVPTDDGTPLLDRHGGPVMCAWMKELGYDDLRSDEAGEPGTRGDWVGRLREAAQTYITDEASATLEIAFQLNYVGNRYEDPSNMCGPLAGAILRDADLLPKSAGRLQDLKSFWLAQGIKEDGNPWRYFPADEYDLYSFDTSIDEFDFSNWPLVPGDIVYTYAGRGEYEHILVVTEVESNGRTYTVTNQEQPDGSFIIERVLLYDPQNMDVGAFRDGWVTDSWGVGRTGLGGFDVLRHRALSLPSGSVFAYTVEAGDTLVSIAGRLNSTVGAVLAVNDLDPVIPLSVGQSLLVPVNVANPVDFPPGAAGQTGE